MAKTEKKAAQTAKNELSVENIEDQIRGLNFSNADAAQAAREKDEEDEKARVVRETRRAQNRAKYVNLYSWLIMKKRRDYARIDKKLADDTKALRDDIEGGKITFREFDENLNTLFNDRRKAIDEADKKHEKLLRELTDAFREKCDTYDLRWQFDNEGRRLW